MTESFSDKLRIQEAVKVAEQNTLDDEYKIEAREHIEPTPASAQF